MDIMLSSLSDGSLKQYNSCLKKWWNFCQRNYVNPVRYNILHLLKFLAEEFEREASHGLNTCRSALAFLLGPEVGNNYQIKRLLKSIERLRPKYETMWNPQLVLAHVKEWSPNNSISLEKLTLKLVTLLALVTAQRIQMLALIDIRNVEKPSEWMEIKIPDRINTSRKK